MSSHLPSNPNSLFEIKKFARHLQSKVEDGVEVLYNQEKLIEVFSSKTNIQRSNIFIIGALLNRSVLIRYSSKYSVLVCLNSQYTDYDQVGIFRFIQKVITITPKIHILEIEAPFWQELGTPNIGLIGLYHPENFPLPRFHLALSNLAAAVRRDVLGSVSLFDMQLGETIDSIYDSIVQKRFDIIGISATFGQQDILDQLMARLQEIPEYRPLIVFGGSLSSLNHKTLLRRYQNSLVAMGSGEGTIAEIIRYHKGKLPIEKISRIAFLNEKGEIELTSKSSPTHQEPFSELDLLEKTLNSKGVMQMESSRGCSYNCSFCPRQHKGKWIGGEANILESQLKYIGKIFDNHPHTARKIFLVDEEFVGYKGGDDVVLERGEQVAEALYGHGFRWETSARLDHVYRTNEDKDWVTRRMTFWRYLVDHGLDRVLFGIESGVDTILKRFNKVTSAEQYRYGIRILSACGIPVRLTYITFDPLMSIEELIATYHFQGRKDLLLNPLPHSSEEEIYHIVHDEKTVSNHVSGRPLYLEIPYMLVSLECLLNSPYLKKVESLGLAREVNHSMGKRNAIYANPIIGLLSHFSQLWIDRNFALDYTLKSIIKYTPQAGRHHYYELRSLFKHAAYHLLGKMLFLVTGDNSLVKEDINTTQWEVMKQLQKDFTQYKDEASRERVLTLLLNRHFEALSDKFVSQLKTHEVSFYEDSRIKIWKEVEKWRRPTNTWTLINKD